MEAERGWQQGASKHLDECTALVQAEVRAATRAHARRLRERRDGVAFAERSREKQLVLQGQRSECRPRLDPQSAG